MLRPATPLTGLLFVSFLLLLLSVLSTPLIKGIPIARYRDVSFGVFGFCSPKTCSKFTIGYNTRGLFGENDEEADFSLPSTARHSLSSLLVVHPVAAFFNLICLGLAAAAHLHSPSHSARYLLALLILLLPTLLVTLLAFLVDILLFVPHLHWGGWIVLASTILITASGVVTCAMRRTLVSRKARKRRIAENAEMSGENFYNRQNTESRAFTMGTPSTVPKLPMVNGAPGSDNLPSFSTYNKETEVGGYGNHPAMNGGPNGFRGGEGEALGHARPRSQGPYERDEYGNPLPSNTHGTTLHRGPSDPSLPYQSMDERPSGLPSGPRGGSGPPRGRGYSPRGGYGPSRSAFGSSRGGPNGALGRGGYHGRGRGGSLGSVGGGMIAGGMATSPPGYPPDSHNYSSDRLGSQPELIRDPGFAGSPPPTVPLATSPPQQGEAFTQREQVSPSSQYSPHNTAVQPPRPGEGMMSPSSVYSGHETYVPPRAEWNSPRTNSPNRNIAGSPPSSNQLRAKSPHYYEDVDPRFSDVNAEPIPSSLAPARPPPSSLPARTPDDSTAHLDAERSPNGSEISQFTSVSQRGVNPAWMPASGSHEVRSMPRRPVGGNANKDDILLQNNPDFQIPGMKMPGRSGYGRPGQGLAGLPGASQADGMGGRYPAP